MKIKGKEIKLIVGLGNPGLKFKSTRHNVGFEAAKTILHKLHQCDKSRKRNLNSIHLRMCSFVSVGFPAVLMNKSGKAVKEAADALRAKPKEILVIHDDLETPYGKWKIKEKGSATGHNGVKSIIEALGSDEFARAKIGIGRPESRDTQAISRYVLEKIPPAEHDKIQQAIDDLVNKLEV